MPRLTGKTCVVTGAAQGIGRGIVDAFVAEGGTVIAVDVHFPPENLLAGATNLILDVTDPQAVAVAAQRFDKASVLVNCVGYVAQGALLDCSIEDFDRSLNVNLRSMYLTSKAFLPAMLKRGEGSIINIASVVSCVMAAPLRLAYATSKAAVVGLTMSVARDYVTRGIRCNAISPGTVDSPSLRERLAECDDIEVGRRAFIDRQPTGRLGTAGEIASIAIVLASDEVKFMTGANIIVDGGMSL